MDTSSLLQESKSFVAEVQAGKKNYYQFLSIPVTATQHEIETAIAKKKKMVQTIQAEDNKTADQLRTILNRIQSVLLNYQERGQYDGRGFREFSPDDVPDLEPEIMAKEIFQKAKALYGQKRYRDCFLAMTHAIKLDGNKAAYYQLIGMSQANLIDYRREAEINLTKASEMEGWNAEPLVALGNLFYQERLFKRAEVYFKRALEIEPSHSVARKRYEEIVGPADTIGDMVMGVMSKVMPTFFKKR